MTWLAYVLGLVTLPALAAVLALLAFAFLPDNTIRQWCDYDPWETTSKARAVRWVQWRVHEMSSAHREGKKLGRARDRKPIPDWYWS